MHLEETTHEHAGSAQVYTYEGEYVVEADQIRWTAEARRGDEARVELSGAIPLSSPGVAAVAEQVVRDAVVAQIDGLPTSP
ncbi:MAG TPA: hypothetical protein VGP22_08735 [Albitalea sp.]|jgi:hypothetical protein|nr:hypothetical protein [Albitalea sp.]